jgi:hypothetical protein
MLLHDVSTADYDTGLAIISIGVGGVICKSWVLLGFEHQDIEAWYKVRITPPTLTPSTNPTPPPPGMPLAMPLSAGSTISCAWTPPTTYQQCQVTGPLFEVCFRGRLRVRMHGVRREGSSPPTCLIGNRHGF